MAATPPGLEDALCLRRDEIANVPANMIATMVKYDRLFANMRPHICGGKRNGDSAGCGARPCCWALPGVSRPRPVTDISKASDRARYLMTASYIVSMPLRRTDSIAVFSSFICARRRKPTKTCA